MEEVIAPENSPVVDAAVFGDEAPVPRQGSLIVMELVVTGLLVE